jgi:hypothetical protein
LKERLVTLGLAVSALALFYVLFLPKPRPADPAAALPTSVETGPNGYQAAWRWLEAERIPVVSLRDRYARLNSKSASWLATGNVMLTTLPQKEPASPEEATQLDLWVERGNTLLVMAAFDDTPLWTLGDQRLVDAAGRITRLKFDVIEDEAPAKMSAKTPVSTPAKTPTNAPDGSPANTPTNAPDVSPANTPQGSPAARHPLSAALHDMLPARASTLEPRGAHPLLEGVHAVSVLSELPASRWRASPMDRSAVLQVGQIAGSGDAALWLRRQGKGQIITFAVASIFSNRLIGADDNARLLSNLIAWSRGSGGAVIFDDAHQGLVDYYDAKAFFADRRLHETLAWIVFLWFVFVLGVQRLRSRSRVWNPADVTAFIAMSGEFFAATVTPADTGARLCANFFNSLRRRLNLPEDGAPVWEWLSAQAKLRAGDLAELRSLHARIHAGRRVDLLRLQNLLSQMQGTLA